MGILQKKCRSTGKKAPAYRGKGGQNTDTDFPALRLGVVLDLLNFIGISGLKIANDSCKVPRGLQAEECGVREVQVSIRCLSAKFGFAIVSWPPPLPKGTTPSRRSSKQHLFVVGKPQSHGQTILWMSGFL